MRKKVTDDSIASGKSSSKSILEGSCDTLFKRSVTIVDDFDKKLYSLDGYSVVSDFQHINFNKPLTQEEIDYLFTHVSETQSQLGIGPNRYPMARIDIDTWNGVKPSPNIKKKEENKHFQYSCC